uniref:Uncharacterized protein n=1 Tax=Oryza rufipogon TaxID=4529 RepID=A0A0E0NIV4_ORYRU
MAASCAGWRAWKALGPLSFAGAGEGNATRSCSRCLRNVWRGTALAPTRTAISSVPPPPCDSAAPRLFPSVYPPLHAGGAAPLLASIFSIPCRIVAAQQHKKTKSR